MLNDIFYQRETFRAPILSNYYLKINWVLWNYQKYLGGNQLQGLMTTRAELWLIFSGTNFAFCDLFILGVTFHIVNLVQKSEEFIVLKNALNQKYLIF